MRENKNQGGFGSVKRWERIGGGYNQNVLYEKKNSISNLKKKTELVDINWW